MIAALFVDPDGCYAGLPDVEVWGRDRDARLYGGPWPVVAHPPCERWSSLAALNEARFGYRVGEDHGCFEQALAAVRAYGGVLEHPAQSVAWPTFGLLKPSPGGWLRGLYDDGWVCQVAQSAYGHPARKRTWLYYVGPEPPELDWTEPDVSGLVGGFGAANRRVQYEQAAATPERFRDLLLGLAGRQRVAA